MRRVINFAGRYTFFFVVFWLLVNLLGGDSKAITFLVEKKFSWLVLIICIVSAFFSKLTSEEIMCSPSIRNMRATEELRRELEEKRQEAEFKRALKGLYWRGRYDLAMDALEKADPEGWEAWYDDDNNVPLFAGGHRQLCLLLEKRIKELNPAWKAPRGRFKGFSYDLIWNTGETK